MVLFHDSRTAKQVVDFVKTVVFNVTIKLTRVLIVRTNYFWLTTTCHVVEHGLGLFLVVS